MKKIWVDSQHFKVRKFFKKTDFFSFSSNTRISRNNESAFRQPRRVQANCFPQNEKSDMSNGSICIVFSISGSFDLTMISYLPYAPASTYISGLIPHSSSVLDRRIRNLTYPRIFPPSSDYMALFSPQSSFETFTKTQFKYIVPVSLSVSFFISGCPHLWLLLAHCTSLLVIQHSQFSKIYHPNLSSSLSLNRS